MHFGKIPFCRMWQVDWTVVSISEHRASNQEAAMIHMRRQVLFENDDGGDIVT